MIVGCALSHLSTSTWESRSTYKPESMALRPRRVALGFLEGIDMSFRVSESAFSAT